MEKKERRKRVNLTMEEDTYRRLQAMSRRYGFGSVCSLVMASVRIVCYRPGHTPHPAPPGGESDEAFIESLFASLSRTAPGPDDTPAPRRRHNRRKE